MMLSTGNPPKYRQEELTIKKSRQNTERGLTLVIDNTQSPKPSIPQSFRRREDRELKRDVFADLPLYGPSPNKLPWEFLRAA
jgi:hypothetical protein